MISVDYYFLNFLIKGSCNMPMVSPREGASLVISELVIVFHILFHKNIKKT